MKVYAVYSIPKSPEYHLDALFETKEAAKAYVTMAKESDKSIGSTVVYDIQIEEVKG